MFYIHLIVWLKERGEPMWLITIGQQVWISIYAQGFLIRGLEKIICKHKCEKTVFKGPKRFLGLGFSVFLFGGRSTFASKRARLELEISTTARNASAEFESRKRVKGFGKHLRSSWLLGFYSCFLFVRAWFFFYPPEISTPFLRHRLGVFCEEGDEGQADHSFWGWFHPRAKPGSPGLWCFSYLLALDIISFQPVLHLHYL
jgi:hypothetical protein